MIIYTAQQCAINTLFIINLLANYSDQQLAQGAGGGQ